MTVRLAAIVVNYKTRSDTLRCIASLRRSSRLCDEIILVDNGSGADEVAALQGAVPDACFISLPSNVGFSGGVNAGLRAALERGAERLLLLNSDAELLPNTLALLERELEARAAGIAGPAIVQRTAPSIVETLGIGYSPRTGRMKLLGWGTRLSPSPRPTATVDALSGCALLIRREVLDAVGMFDERYFYSFEDVEFCFRARRSGMPSICVTEAIVLHEGSLSIGAVSSRRNYFAARNHLLMAAHVAPASAPWSVVRGTNIVALNVLHALGESEGRGERLRAVARGTLDYFRGRFGSD